ncbi:MAG: hypothetical protein R2942_03635 [Ignavibacteria bacterium]
MSDVLGKNNFQLHSTQDVQDLQFPGAEDLAFAMFAFSRSSCLRLIPIRMRAEDVSWFENFFRQWMEGNKDKFGFMS